MYIEILGKKFGDCVKFGSFNLKGQCILCMWYYMYGVYVNDFVVYMCNMFDGLF